MSERKNVIAINTNVLCTYSNTDCRFRTKGLSFIYVPVTTPFVFVHIIILPSSHDNDFIEICNSELNNYAYYLYINIYIIFLKSCLVI